MALQLNSKAPGKKQTLTEHKGDTVPYFSKHDLTHKIVSQVEESKTTTPRTHELRKLHTTTYLKKSQFDQATSTPETLIV